MLSVVHKGCLGLYKIHEKPLFIATRSKTFGYALVNRSLAATKPSIDLAWFHDPALVSQVHKKSVCDES